MFKHILVPTDGSPLSLHAARAAAQLAKLSGARITAFYVAPAYKTGVRPDNRSAEFVTPEEYDEEVRCRADRHLGEVAALAKAQGVQVDGRYALSDFPAEAIVRAVEQFACDTVAMGSRRSEDLTKMGSVTQGVLVDARVPVLVT